VKQDLDSIMQQLPLYVLGLLESEEARAIEALARTNVVVAAEIAALTAATSLLITDGSVASAPPRIGDRLRTSIGHGRFERHAPRIARIFDVDMTRARALLGDIDRPALWEPMAPDMPSIMLQHFTAGPACAGSDTGFVRVAAGTTFPWHGHDGDEVTLVLAGSSRDYSGTILTAGDEFALNGGSAHEFTALGDQDYIYAVRVVGVRFDVPKPDKL
jgi:hypothetical protein